MAKFIEHDVNLSVELYRNGENFCAWLSDNMGGSGIEAVGETPEKLADNLSPYIADYFYEESDEEDDEEEVATTPTIKVLCYTDETDNTKGTILAINKETDTKTDKMAELINAELVKQGFFNEGDDPMEINEVSRQIAFLGESKHEDYSFYFEEVSLIG